MWRVEGRETEREVLAPKMRRGLEGGVEDSLTQLRGP